MRNASPPQVWSYGAAIGAVSGVITECGNFD
ncbi:hypothetical protein YM18_0250 [Geobacter sulfurreducens]|nr:hypothetical protein YM18_0250 [Geobacter sulfurreducens]